MGKSRFIQGLTMLIRLKKFILEYIDIMNNSHLIDEAYIELKIDEKKHRGEW